MSPTTRAMERRDMVRLFNRYFFIGLAVGIVLTLGMLLVAGWALFTLKSSPEDMAASLTAPDLPEGPRLSLYGQADPDWSVRTLEGEEVRLSDFAGRVVFLNFWATWCIPCVAEMPSIQRLYESLADEDVAFLLVSEEDAETVRSLLEARDLNLPVYLGVASAIYQSKGIPVTFIIDRDGTIVFRHLGSADWDQEACRAFIRRLL
ncbi:MAG: TlpA family protein disulfide reductase [bacterium]|nr:TlpA family protein disulfide reductase [bacterium]